MKIEFTILEKSLIILSILLVFFLLAQWLYFKYKKKIYTREKFAFFGINSFITFTSFLLPTILGSSFWMKIIAFFLFHFFDKKIEVEEPDFSDRILVILILAIVGRLIYGLFNKWNGSPSVRFEQLNSVSERSGIFQDYKAFLTDKNSRVHSTLKTNKYEGLSFKNVEFEKHRSMSRLKNYLNFIQKNTNSI